MSIISTIYVPEGIVMAADSRITGKQERVVDGKKERDSFTISDNGQKIVKLNKVKVGINFCGNMIKDGNTIADCLRLFEIDVIKEDDSVKNVADKLFDYMGGFTGTAFTVGGYNHDEAFVYSVTDHVERVNTSNGFPGPCINFNGQTEAINKLLALEPRMKISLDLMPLKDGIDFAQFLIDLTIKYERFQDSIQTCGGPIDVLVITKDNIFWHRHKIYAEKEW